MSKTFLNTTRFGLRDYVVVRIHTDEEAYRWKKLRKNPFPPKLEAVLSVRAVLRKNADGKLFVHQNAESNIMEREPQPREKPMKKQKQKNYFKHRNELMQMLSDLASFEP